MIISLAMVSSIDGKITKGEAPSYEWASPEDQQLFFAMIEQAPVIVMGRKTYESARQVIKLRPGKLRVVMTRKPAEFLAEVVKGQLEFSSESAAELVSRLDTAGVEEILVVGGSQVAAEFLDAGLVNYFYLTIEPEVFGAGQNTVAALSDKKFFQLAEVKRLNVRGTLLLKYKTADYRT